MGHPQGGEGRPTGSSPKVMAHSRTTFEPFRDLLTVDTAELRYIDRSGYSSGMALTLSLAFPFVPNYLGPIVGKHLGV